MTTHDGLEFQVDKPNGETAYFDTFDAAAGLAIAIAGSNGKPVNIDVLAWSEDAARAWGGDDGVERYREDPDASIFERIVIRAESIGRIA